MATFGDITADTVVTGGIADTASAQELTNKRITPRVQTSANPSAFGPDGDLYDIATITGLAQALTFSSPSGTPTEGRVFRIRIIDNGSAQTLTFNVVYQGGALGLPATSLGSTTVSLLLTFYWDSSVSKWRLTGKIT